MTSTTRDRMVASAALLLSRAGLAEASFRNVLEASGAPRGSIYHHFPGGKDELVQAAVLGVGERVVGALRAQPPATPEEVVLTVAGLFRRVIAGPTPDAGCAVAAVVTAAPGGSAGAKAAAGVLQSWEAELTRLFHGAGLDPARSMALATTTLAVVEGALVLARAHGDAGPFDTAVEQLLELVRS